MRGHYFRSIAACLIGVTLLPMGAISQDAENTADYFSYVNWDYKHRNQLKGWSNTAKAIQASLEQWGYSVQHHHQENTDLATLERFRETIIGQKTNGLKLIYVASHQSPSGRFDFPNEDKEFWSVGFDQHTKVSGSPSILILDTCHADVIPTVRLKGNLPFHFLLSAAAASEETYELRMFARRPVDFRRRYKAEVHWMRQQLGKEWEGQISFTGFIWVRQFLKTPTRPSSHEQWRTFLSGMTDEAQRFARERSRDLSSTIILRE